MSEKNTNSIVVSSEMADNGIEEERLELLQEIIEENEDLEECGNFDIFIAADRINILKNNLEMNILRQNFVLQNPEMFEAVWKVSEQLSELYDLAIQHLGNEENED